LSLRSKPLLDPLSGLNDLPYITPLGGHRPRGFYPLTLSLRSKPLLDPLSGSNDLPYITPLGGHRPRGFYPLILSLRSKQPGRQLNFTTSFNVPD
jgi:uncharacterized membrane protein YgdD (TMEM256/DUF423 family)